MLTAITAWLPIKDQSCIIKFYLLSILSKDQLRKTCNVNHFNSWKKFLAVKIWEVTGIWFSHDMTVKNKVLFYFLILDILLVFFAPSNPRSEILDLRLFVCPGDFKEHLEDKMGSHALHCRGLLDWCGYN